MKLPQRLNDGRFEYQLVRQQEDLENGLSNVALYESIPRDERYQFTPDLAFILAFEKGQTRVPIMQKLER
jgi:hypothetical protein